MLSLMLIQLENKLECLPPRSILRSVLDLQVESEDPMLSVTKPGFSAVDAMGK